MTPPHELEYRVTYGDTDKMGVVYYANYLTFFEMGRTELMRDKGLRYRDLEETHKIFLPVTEANIRFVSPARYDELLKIKTSIKAVGPASVEYAYVIESTESGKKIVEGMTRHPFVNYQWKPVRIPAFVKAILDK